MKHQATKSPSDELYAAEWNAEHLLTEGLDADKPTSGLTARQLYWATDTKKLYKATSATTWEVILRGVWPSSPSLSDETASRALNTNYQNTTGASLIVYVTCKFEPGENEGWVEIRGGVGSSTPTTTVQKFKTYYKAQQTHYIKTVLLVPKDWYYAVGQTCSAGVVTLESWFEQTL